MSTIGIDARLLYYRQGGIAAYTRHLIEQLAALDSTTRYDILHSRKDPHTLAPGPNFARVSLWTPSHHRLESWALAAEIIRLRLDVLHSPDFIPPLRGARRYVITVHDLNFLYYPQFLTADSRRYYSGQIARAVRQADHILACSQATRNDLIERLGVPESRITVHLEGVDSSFHPLPEEEIAAACRTLSLPRGFILFVGTFEPRKNLAGLLDAYHRLRVSLSDAPPLVLAGRRGWLYETLFERVANLGLEAHVLWREDIPQPLLPALYNAAAVLVLPSFYEGFGLTALEAMACGTPVIVTNRSAPPEIVGEAGLLIDPDQPEEIAARLQEVLTDSALSARLRRAGLARAAMFTWQQTATVTHRVYQQLLSS
ncbi:MAG: glycosyltransferase family 4 protein [Anaerolineae bacterium]|nr:glycosyltransferase family 4 protein [Anaerolineae bacterium]